MIWFLVFIFILLCALLVFLILKLRVKTPVKVVKDEISFRQDHKVPTIDDLISVVSDKSISKNTLFNTCRIFVEKLSIPKKQNSQISSEAKKYLDFISIVVLHKKVDAKLIVYLEKNAKKNNPEYEYEIELISTTSIERRNIIV